MAKLIVAFVFILTFLNYGALCAQNSDELIVETLSHLKQHRKDKFEASLISIFPTYLKENLPNYQNSTKFLRGKKYNEVYQNLNSLIQEDYFLEEIKVDKNFKILHNRKDWKVFKLGLDKRINQYNNTIRLLLKNIQYKDQGIRLVLLYQQKKQPQDSALTILVNRQMKEIDLESAESVKKIIDEHGWLGKDKIGKEANEMLFLAIQHVDDSVAQTKYLPILAEAIKSKAAEPWQYAFLTDRLLMNQGKKQRYGTQTIISDKEYGGYIVPLENPDQVDELRQEMGLESLKEYLKEFDIDWDIEKYKREETIIEKRYKARFESLRKRR
ncbi:DUF6624 domain-containing protein [Chitinophaga solisilvae]|uniref:DUF6624 domain-containing protein n=1 Tax=Chitinophaga solisilvae TaxID=1233460 RepID=UPI001370DB7A|nr:DUF6624 domain-containing protein [Chitinophaga solisilvae]